MQAEYVWREGWNRASGDPGIRNRRARFPLIPAALWSRDDEPSVAPTLETVPHVSQGQPIGRGVLHAWLHKLPEDDEYLMGLEGHVEHFVAAGPHARNVQVAFTQLYLTASELERVSKLQIPGPAAQDIASLNQAGLTQAQAQATLAGLGRQQFAPPPGGSSLVALGSLGSGLSR